MTTSRTVGRLTAISIVALGIAFVPAAARAEDEPDVVEVPAVDPLPEWLTNALEVVKTGTGIKRREALDEIVEKDEDGSSLTPLIALLPEIEEQGAQLDVVRALGRDQLFDAAPPIEALLDSKDDSVRSYAAVSLEYIGSPDSVKPLLKRMKKERDEAVQNHIARAAGRCGHEDDAARKALIKLCSGGKSEFQGLGAVIGLAYFEGDEKAARGLEKALNKLGPPAFGRRGGAGEGTMRRTLLAWAIAEVKDPKSSAFIEKKMLKPIRNAQSPWAKPTQDFYENVIAACDGDPDAMGAVENSVRFVMGISDGGALRDGARKDRDNTKFTPKADWDPDAAGDE